MTNQTAPSAHHPKPEKPSNESLAITSLIMGIVSMTGPGLLLGIPAVITGFLAMKKSPDNHGISIGGIVTGAISTVVSFLFIMFIIMIAIVALLSPPSDPTQPGGGVMQPFDSSRI